MNDPETRKSWIDPVLADAPQVHEGAADAGSQFGDVWATDRGCYEFLAEHCGPGRRTLETGLGVSTVLFAAWGCDHTCVVPFEKEVEKCRAHLRERSVDDSRTRYIVGWSDDVLPTLSGPLDLVFVDGGHGFPVPIIDWYYAGRRLVEGGVIVFDDAQLPQVSEGILPFIEADPRWQPLERTWKWAAYRRLSSGPLMEEWFQQDFLPDVAAQLS